MSAATGNGRASESLRPEVGILEWFELGERERVERVVEELNELGIRHLRTGVSWADWLQEGGEEWYAWLLPRLAEDFELLPCLHFTPPSRGVVPKVQAPPRRLRDYADFLDVFLDAHGDLIEHVELWNEPNNLNDWDWTLDRLWLGFSEMIGDAANWARERGKKTVLGGMCPTDPNWLSLMGERGLLELIDVVGVHAFPGIWASLWQGWEHEIERTREVLDRWSPGTDIWVTETGFSTWRQDEAGQLHAFLEARETRGVRRLYWYAAEDLHPSRRACDGFHNDVRQYHFGLHRADGEPKLLARAWKQGRLPLVRRLGALDGNRRRRRAPHVLITGGAGFVGTNLADRLIREGERVLVLDNLARPGVERNLLWLKARHGDRIAFELADVRDPLALARSLEGARRVVHLAAQVAVTTSLERPLEDFRTNVEGTVLLLEEIRKQPEPPPLLITSTNKVYGSLPDLPLERLGERWEPRDRQLREHGVSEARPLDFCTPYGCSKGAADQYVLDYAKQYGLPALVFRMSCIYGEHQWGNEDQGWVAHFARSLLAGEEIVLYGDGAQVRDILHASDLVEAMLRALESAGTLAGTPFNVGGGPDNSVSLLEILELLAELAGEEPRLRHAEERAGDQRWYVSDTSRLRAATGWAPAAGVQDGVESMVDWLKRDRRRPDRRRRGARARAGAKG